jgi:hypothetical protein
VAQGDPVWDRAFGYTPWALRAFYLVRRLAALRIDRRAYWAFVGTDPLADFPHELAALEHEGLIRSTAEAITPTELGMFYADSIAALFAWREVQARRRQRAAARAGSRLGDDDNSYGHM